MRVSLQTSLIIVLRVTIQVNGTAGIGIKRLSPLLFMRRIISGHAMPWITQTILVLILKH